VGSNSASGRPRAAGAVTAAGGAGHARDRGRVGQRAHGTPTTRLPIHARPDGAR